MIRRLSLIALAALAPGLAFAADIGGLPSPERIGLRAGDRLAAAGERFLPLAAEAALPEAQRQRMFLVQFEGPADEASLAALRSAGIEPFQYVPPFAYLCYGDPQRAASLQTPSRMRWTGEWRLQDTMAPEVVSAANAANAARTEARDAANDLRVIVQMADLPGTVTALQTLKAYAHDPLQPGRFANHYTLRMTASAADLAAIASTPLVYNVEPEAAYTLNGGRQATIVAGGFTPGDICLPAPAPGTRYSDFLARKGVDGSGTIVHVMDDGVDRGDTSGAPGTSHPDLAGKLLANFNVTILPNAEGVAGHGTINAGIATGSPIVGTTDPQGFLLGQGIAPGAALIATKLFRDSGAFDIGNKSFADLLRQAAPFHPAVATNSWGSDLQGAYTADSADFDALVRDSDSLTPGDQQMPIVFSAGNAGNGSGGPTRTIGAPATGKSMIAVGATENCDPAASSDGCGTGAGSANNLNQLATFSSQGPTVDNRFGITVVAPGTHIRGVASTSPSFDGSGVCGGPTNNFAFPPADAYFPAGQTAYTWSTGTSHSAPAVAGAVALFTDYYSKAFGVRPSPALVRAAIANTATDIGPFAPPGVGNPGRVPNNSSGWGLLNLNRLIPDSGGFAPRVIKDQAQRFTATGQAHEFPIVSLGGATPLKITLAWTDAPALAGANPTIVNDLDLQLIQNDVVYFGNVFTNGASTSGGQADRRNTIEAVYLNAPAGAYTVRVVTANLGGNGVPEAAGGLDQDYALFVEGGLEQSSRGTVGLDAEYYRVPATVKIEVSDLDLRGAGSIEVEARTDSEPSGEEVELIEAQPATGVFRGAIDLNASPAPDKLRAKNGDRIHVVYEDEDTGDGEDEDVQAEAHVDTKPPVISNVRVSLLTQNSAVIEFTTNEPARGDAKAGIDCPTAPSAFGGALETVHAVKILSLQPDTLYQFRARAQDAAGNVGESACTPLLTPKDVCFSTFDFESGVQSPFTHAAILGVDDWSIVTNANAHSGTRAWTISDGNFQKDAWLAAPAPADPLPPNARFSFWHTFELEPVFDGGMLEYSLNGVDWFDLGPQIVKGGYNSVFPPASHPQPNRENWSGGAMGAMTQVIVDLSPFVGLRPSIRFRMICDVTQGAVGWAIDDVQFCYRAGRRAEAHFDGQAYAADDAVGLFVVDTGLTQATATAGVRSTTEPQLELVTLNRVGEGLYFGSIFARAGGSGHDGQLRVSHGDLLEAFYYDPNDGNGASFLASDEARADLHCPVLLVNGAFAVSSRSAEYRIQTDEPADIDLTVTPPGGAPLHFSAKSATSLKAVLNPLQPCTKYDLVVEVVDALGNRCATDGDTNGQDLVTRTESALFFDGMDGGINPGWSHSAALGVDDWKVNAYALAHSAPNTWFTSDPSIISDTSLRLPPLNIDSTTRLSFWHVYQFEPGGGSVGFDGGVLEISTNGGQTWQDLEPGFLFGAKYDLPLSANFGSPLAGRRAFTGGTLGPMRQVTVELSAWAGAGRIVRFRIGTDSSVAGVGWRIDDVSVTSALPCGIESQSEAGGRWRMYR